MILEDYWTSGCWKIWDCVGFLSTLGDVLESILFMFMTGWSDLYLWMLFWDDGLYMDRWCLISFAMHSVYGLNWNFMLLVKKRFFWCGDMNMNMSIWGMIMNVEDEYEIYDNVYVICKWFYDECMESVWSSYDLYVQVRYKNFVSNIFDNGQYLVLILVHLKTVILFI